MVELAKQTTSHLDMVHIQIGDAADMPNDDASFDVAISLLVTGNLSPEAFEKHLQELHRVLVPNGRTILLTPTDWSHSRLYTKIEADPTTVEESITQMLAKVPKHPATAQVKEAFDDSNDIIMICFAVDVRGDIFHVKKTNLPSYGQPIWRKTEVMIFFLTTSTVINQLLPKSLLLLCTLTVFITTSQKREELPTTARNLISY